MENQAQHSEPTIKKELALWEMFDKAQMNRFLDKYKGETLVIGFNRFEIIGAFLNSHNSPCIELHQHKEGETSWHSVQLSLVDDQFQYFSSEDWEGRYRLLREMGINPDEVKV